MTNAHYSHKVLGKYCWDCQRPTSAGIPGWSKTGGSDGPKVVNIESHGVVWADGSMDTVRVCTLCRAPRCKFPVHDEAYKTVTSGVAKAFDTLNGVC